MDPPRIGKTASKSRCGVHFPRYRSWSTNAQELVLGHFLEGPQTYGIMIPRGRVKRALASASSGGLVDPCWTLEVLLFPCLEGPAHPGNIASLMIRVEFEKGDAGVSAPTQYRVTVSTGGH